MVWIQSILSSLKASVHINGSHNGYVRYQRGLQQGDPLFPMLFTLVTNVLSSMFQHALNSKVLVGDTWEFGSRWNLHYVDDVLVLINHERSEDLRF